MNYTIMLGEVKGDVDKKWQPDLKELFEAAFSYLNRVFKKSLKSPPSFRKEEIQGVFVEGAAAYLYYRQLKMLLFPLSVRIGLGKGSITRSVRKHLKARRISMRSGRLPWPGRRMRALFTSPSGKPTNI